MKVILADSTSLIRVGLRSVFSNQKDVQIVGEANSSDELLSIIDNFEADVIVLDFTAPNFSIDVIPEVNRRNSNVRFVAITPEQEAFIIVDAMRAGVHSYVKKDCSLQEIKECVEATYNGNKFFCGQILEKLGRANTDLSELDFDGFTCDPILLSDRENEIIKFIAEGFTNPQIAEKIHLSAHTINTHRKNIMNKLGVKNTAGIVLYAVKINLVSPNKFLFTGEN
jgi:DNA-binding NarL/FixJ family response regulator